MGRKPHFLFASPCEAWYNGVMPVGAPILAYVVNAVKSKKDFICACVQMQDMG